jgi:endogenous inhibitor of DNA gyrase (YacG/DUF329 family)
MKTCKNDGCENHIKEERTYCSVRCKNIYFNKHLCNYKKLAEEQSGEKKYYENAKKCIKCDKTIEYKGRKNDFCSHYCSSVYYSTGRVLTNKTKEKLSSIRINYLSKIGYVYITNCKGCGKEIDKKEKKIYCSDGCRKKFKRKDMDKRKVYKFDCAFKFNLADFKDEFNFDLVKKHGWYSPSNSKKPNLNGVSRDHMFSIDEGFKNNVDPNIISHPANCMLIIQRENSKKYKKSSITLEELKERIKNWDLKYKF